MGFPVNSDGSSSSVALSTASPIQIPTASGSPMQSREVDIRMNLPAGDPVIAAAFDITDPLTYNHSTSVTVFDSLGDSHVMTYYFKKSAPNEWDVYTAVDGQQVNIADTGTGAGRDNTQPTNVTPTGAVYRQVLHVCTFLLGANLKANILTF